MKEGRLSFKLNEVLEEWCERGRGEVWPLDENNFCLSKTEETVRQREAFDKIQWLAGMKTQPVAW